MPDKAPSVKPGEPPVGPNHALLIGMVAGALAAFGERLGEVLILDTADGIHTDAFLIERPSGSWRVTVKPEDVREP
jgi:hypothetical protein